MCVSEGVNERKKERYFVQAAAKLSGQGGQSNDAMARKGQSSWRNPSSQQFTSSIKQSTTTARLLFAASHPLSAPSIRLSFVCFSSCLHADDAQHSPLIPNHNMAAAAVDAGYLAASYSVPETTIHSLLSAPTTELVQALLVQIEARAREFEDLQSDKLKADVELDNAIQTGEQRARALKAAADKAQKDADEQRQRVAEEGATRHDLSARSKCADN